MLDSPNLIYINFYLLCIAFSSIVSNRLWSSKIMQTFTTDRQALLDEDQMLDWLRDSELSALLRFLAMTRIMPTQTFWTAAMLIPIAKVAEQIKNRPIPSHRAVLALMQRCLVVIWQLQSAFRRAWSRLLQRVEPWRSWPYWLQRPLP